MSQIIANRYEVEARIGEGAMGEVYRGIDRQTRNRIAIKALKSSSTTPELIERFTREGQALRQLNHPNIVKVLDTIQEHGQHYIIMEFVDGGSLHHRLLEDAPLPINRVLQIALGLADALTRAHQLGIIHRDIKPGNILLAADGTARLTDFGIAHIDDSPTMTHSGTTFGTIDYLSPEAVGGQVVDHRADIWAFGVTLYEMLTGVKPFKGDNYAAVLNNILHKNVSDLVQIRPDAPADLVDLIQHMLTKNRDQRASSVRSIGADIEAILRGEPTTSAAIRRATVAMPAVMEDKTTTISTGLGIPKHNLPTQTTPFIGRRRELAELDGMLASQDTRLITLLGPGGIGKTRLSLEIATRQFEKEGIFADGVYFVELAPLTTKELVITALAEAIQFDFFGSLPQHEQLFNYLRDKEMLVVLDNFEHLMDCATYIPDMLAAAPQTKIIVTSRERLNLHSEWVFNVDGLDVPEWISPEELMDYGAIQLFVQSARRARPDFQLTDANKDAVTSICQMTQGMPLGIELAAAWVEILSVEDILAELETSYDILETELRDVPERHRSIRAVFEYSWNLMTDDEREVFSKLSVFKKGFTRDAAQKIADASLRSLTTLVNKSLLRRLPSGRYEVHELLRQYGMAALTENDAVYEATMNRHSDYYLDLAARDATLEIAGVIETVRELEEEIENIRCAIDAGIYHRKADKLQKLLATMATFYETRNLLQEAIDVFTQITDAFRHDPVNQILYASAMTRLAMSHLRIGHSDEAAPYFEEAFTLAKQYDLHLDRIRLLQWMSYLTMSRGHYNEAKDIVCKGITFARSIPDARYELASSLAHVGYVHFLLGEFNEAKATIEESIEMMKGYKDFFLNGYNANNLGEVLRAMGNHVKAQKLFTESYAIFEDAGYRRGMAFTSNNLGGLAQMRGDLNEAERNYRQGYRLNKHVGDRVGIGHSLSALGNLAFMQNNIDDARDLYQQSLDVRRDIPDPRGIADSLIDLSEVAMYQSDFALAKQYLDESLDIERELNDRTGQSRILASYGMWAMWQADYEQARFYFEESLVISQTMQESLEGGWILANLAIVDIEQERYSDAITRMDAIRHLPNDQDLDWALAWGGCITAIAEIYQGNLDEARTLLIEGLQVGVKNANPLPLRYGILGMAELLTVEDRYEDALKLVVSVMDKHTRWTHPITQIRGKRLVEKLGKKLPPATFQAIQNAPLAAQDAASEFLARLASPVR